MLITILLAALLVPGDTAQAAPVDQAGERVCRTMGEIGSRLARRRVCKTRAEWAAEAAESRAHLDQAQTHQNNPTVDELRSAVPQPR